MAQSTGSSARTAKGCWAKKPAAWTSSETGFVVGTRMMDKNGSALH